MNGRRPGPCETPDPGHDGEVHLYVNGLRCDAHSPWAQKNLPQPPGERAPAIYTYRAAPPEDTTDQERP